MITGKETLRVRFELTRCDAPLVPLSQQKACNLKTSAVGRLAPSAHLSILPVEPEPFKPDDQALTPTPNNLIRIILIPFHAI